jgi:hypothetical protein
MLVSDTLVKTIFSKLALRFKKNQSSKLILFGDHVNGLLLPRDLNSNLTSKALKLIFSKILPSQELLDFKLVDI